MAAQTPACSAKPPQVLLTGQDTSVGPCDLAKELFHQRAHLMLYSVMLNPANRRATSRRVVVGLRPVKRMGYDVCSFAVAPLEGPCGLLLACCGCAPMLLPAAATPTMLLRGLCMRPP